MPAVSGRTLRLALLAGIVGLALALRLVGIDWGLPAPSHPAWSFHPDELYVIMWADWLREGRLIPEQFNYGGTLYYSFLNACLDIARASRDAVPGMNLLADALLVARHAVLLASLLGVLLVHATGRLLFDEATGLVAALIAAVAPLNVFIAQQARPDALGVLLVAALAYLAARILRAEAAGTWAHFAVLGALAGVVVAFRFPLVVVAAAPATALLVRLAEGQARGALLRILLLRGSVAAAVALAAYAVSSPHSVAHPEALLAGLRGTAEYESQAFADVIGHGPLVVRHLLVLLPPSLGPAVFVLAVAGVVVAARRRSQADLALLAAVLAYALPLATATWIVARYGAPFVPLLAILGARAAVALVRSASGRPARAALAAVVALALAWSAAGSLAFSLLEAGRNVREDAGDWLQRNVGADELVLLVKTYAGDQFYFPVFTKPVRHAAYLLGPDADASEPFRRADVAVVVLPEPYYRPMDRLGELHPQAEWRSLRRELAARGFVPVHEIKPRVRLLGLDFSGWFTAHDHLVVHHGIRIYRREATTP